MTMHSWKDEVKIDAIVGKVIVSINGMAKHSEKVTISTSDGKDYIFLHEPDCCESVELADFELGSDDFAGATIISAEEVCSSDDELTKPSEYSDSWTWTFYKIETTKGEIWMRWLGESNGYYSESVEIFCVDSGGSNERD